MASSSRVVFSDIDGTLVHYPNTQERVGKALPSKDDDYEAFQPNDRDEKEDPDMLLKLPQSATGLVGVISMDTLSMAQQLRNAGHRFVLVTGARSKTSIQRMPHLPMVDAFVMENGGRIMLLEPDHTRGPSAPATSTMPDTQDLCTFLNITIPYKEDTSWRERHSDVAGPTSQDHLAPEERKGALWDTYRELKSSGWKLDALSYTTCFRITTRGKEEAFRAVMASLPPSLACSFNLGKADIYPATSGKDRATEYIMEMFGAAAEDCVAMCDDDNDILMAQSVGHAYLPGITSETMDEIVAQRPDHFTVAGLEGTRGTEQVMRQIIEVFGCSFFDDEEEVAFPVLGGSLDETPRVAQPGRAQATSPSAALPRRRGWAPAPGRVWGARTAQHTRVRGRAVARTAAPPRALLLR